MDYRFHCSLACRLVFLDSLVFPLSRLHNASCISMDSIMAMVEQYSMVFLYILYVGSLIGVHCVWDIHSWSLRHLLWVHGSCSAGKGRESWELKDWRFSENWRFFQEFSFLILSMPWKIRENFSSHVWFQKCQFSYLWWAARITSWWAVRLTCWWAAGIISWRACRWAHWLAHRWTSWLAHNWWTAWITVWWADWWAAHLFTWIAHFDLLLID